MSNTSPKSQATWYIFNSGTYLCWGTGMWSLAAYLCNQHLLDCTLLAVLAVKCLQASPNLQNINKKTCQSRWDAKCQPNCLTALGGYSLFSTTDLTSSFYNMPRHVISSKYSTFTTSMGLYAYNICAGPLQQPWELYRLMTSIFRNQ